MFHFFVTLPKFALIILLIVVFNLTTQFILFLFNKYSIRGILKGSSGSAEYTSALNGVFSIILAFVFIGVWQDHTRVNEIVIKESTLIWDIARNIEAYPEEQKKNAVPAFNNYIEEVIYKEYDSVILKGKPDINALIKLKIFNDIILSYEPKTYGQLALHQEILRLFSEYRNIREDRIDNNQALIADILWEILIVISILYIFLLCLADIKSYAYHSFILFIFSTCLSMIFALLILYDHPFLGSQAVDYSNIKKVYESYIKLNY